MRTKMLHFWLFFEYNQINALYNFEQFNILHAVI